MVYTMIAFSDGNPHLDTTRLYYDISFMVCIGGNLLVHVYFLVKDSFLSTKAKIKAKCCKKKAKLGVSGSVPAKTNLRAQQ